jgi:Peptidase family S51
VRTILLGPQRRPTVDAVVRGLPADGPFATVTAGWQEREADDGELSARLGSRDINLRLHKRWLDVQDSDPEYAAGERQVQAVLAELQDIYLVRLDHALQAVYALQSHSGQDRLLADAVTQAIAAVRELDAAHLRRVSEVRGEFFQRLQPHDRPVIAGHRAAVASLLAGSAAVVIAGGDVRVLADVLHLFNVAAALRAEAPGWPVIAWSAGAMALADRIVLFHDRAPQGPGHPEVYGSGLSALRDVVLLPHARARLLLDDTPRMATFARRFAPARCVLLDQGARIEVSGDGRWPHGTRVLAWDGHVSMLEAA